MTVNRKTRRFLKKKGLKSFPEKFEGEEILQHTNTTNDEPVFYVYLRMPVPVGNRHNRHTNVNIANFFLQKDGTWGREAINVFFNTVEEAKENVKKASNYYKI